MAAEIQYYESPEKGAELHKSNKQESDWRTKGRNAIYSKTDYYRTQSTLDRRGRASLTREKLPRLVCQRKMGTKGKVSKYTVSLFDSWFFCLFINLLKQTSFRITLRKQQFKAKLKDLSELTLGI